MLDADGVVVVEALVLEPPELDVVPVVDSPSSVSVNVSSAAVRDSSA